MREKTFSNNWTFQMREKTSSSNRKFQILWYNPPPFLRVFRTDTMHCGFAKCKYSNCDMTFSKLEANISQAVIFDGYRMPQNLTFTRPNGQIWIFAHHEPPRAYRASEWWNKIDLFNWTMTYNKDIADIFLPYGEILRHKRNVIRDFKSIAQNKNRTLLLVTSHCQTRSKRLEYVKVLQKCIDVEVLGLCGKNWSCGQRLRHGDNCFQLLNTFKFYLAFENSLCHQYFTEKFYENFSFDSIMLIRGGSHGEARQLFPKGTHIATDDFKTIKDLGNFLKHLSVDKYAHLLQRKSQYYSPGYLKVYQRAMCNICKRMNFMNKYTKIITNIQKEAFGLRPCHQSKDVTKIRRLY
ncbi:glycoprotein 3-alpha-L-fucosyltransferase A-like [Mercenaria mercenaria]|uniref:glycoprotein 3-alpha-L-fucosyltransferase A-like n=1 Tax=Mercenaria mercenaria TaxID=6596 RepID=UPI00234F897C|nr:glycoprotein 3-alpha-L-fucosyltransferase A-like [Mercenaria mercenaria]XP_053385501.1 glycoprotein 3-alpha-L-fucosyltransferase A-like [Mercenaria mercenaria]